MVRRLNSIGNNRLLIAFLLSLSLCLSISCNLETQPERKITIGFSQCCNDLWRDMMEQEMLMELSFHPEVNFEMMVSDNNSETQIAQIRELVAKEIDILIVAPNETGPLTAIVEEVYNQGIPVILLDRKVNSEKYTAFISANNYEIGKTAGEYLVSRFAGKGKVLELQISMSISPAIERSRGFRDVLKKHPNLEVVDAVNTGGNIEQLKDTLPSFITQYPDVNIIYGHTDFVSQTAYQTLDDLEKAKDIFFVGVDGVPGNEGGLQAIEDGILNASMLYPAGGTEAIQLALDILNNRPFSKKNTLQTTVIDERNVRIMKLQTNKILSQQKNIERQQDRIEEQVRIYQDQRNILYMLVFLLVTALTLGALVVRSLFEKQLVNKRLAAKNQEISNQKDQLAKLSEKNREATQAKFRFFTNISHEFRTPLTLVLGAVEDLIKPGMLSKPEARQDARLIRKNALRLLRLINQLMDFRKIENNKLAIKTSKNDLIAFTRQVMDAFQKVAEKREIDFRLFHKDSTIQVWFDRDMMDKVLFNLLSNAFKFTKDGGRIHFSIEQNHLDHTVKIQLEDNGRGMSPEHAAHAFDRFYQGESYQAKGTGLGLSLSKELIQLHHGKITVDSVKNKGTRFDIVLPLGDSHLKTAEIIDNNQASVYNSATTVFLDTPSPAYHPSSTKTQEHSLLIIEDNEELRAFLVQKLSAHYQIIQAADGQKGIEIAMTQIPDLILSDIRMPLQDGLSLTKALKLDIRTSHIPIILLTAQTAMEHQIEGIQTGADAYITKPFNLTFLLENIKNLLQSRQILKERFSNQTLSQTDLSGMNKVDSEFIQQFSAFVAANFHRQDFQVQDLCEKFNLSRVQLYRKVTALLGQNVSDYIQQVRLDKAKQLLVRQEMTIAEIAYSVGYTSAGYFSTAFKGKFEVSPSVFRKEGK